MAIRALYRLRSLKVLRLSHWSLVDMHSLGRWARDLKLKELDLRTHPGLTYRDVRLIRRTAPGCRVFW